MDFKHFIKGYIYRKQAQFFKTVYYTNRLANLAEIPVVVSAKSLRTLQCGVPCARKGQGKDIGQGHGSGR
jgi:hypothetical protein